VSGRRIQRRRQQWSTPQQTWLLLEESRHLYDGWQCIADLNGSLVIQYSYAWGTDLSGSRTGAGGVGGLLWVRKHTSPDAGRYFAAYDGNGNVTALYNETGAIVARYEYGPFGEALRTTATHSVGGANPWRWSTKRTDPTTDLVHYEYRVYDSSAGRWLSRDPIGERGGVNVYGFVYNSPLNYWDFLGNDGQSNLELLKEELGEESYDTTLCKKFSSVATGVLNETPIGQAKIALTGKDLLDKAVDGGEQATAGIGFGLPVIKKAGQCCKTLYVCLKVRLFGKKTKLNDLDVYVGLIQDGKVIKSAAYPDNPLLAPSHESLAKQLGLLGEDRKLPVGVEAFTVCKQNGKLGFRGSNNFNPELSPEARKKLEKLFE